jgi:hypothetical protein
LALEAGNLNEMLSLMTDLLSSKSGRTYLRLEKLKKRLWIREPYEKKAVAAEFLLDQIQRMGIGKGFYAQALAEKIISEKVSSFAIPEYIRDAILWVIETHD